MTGKFEMTGKSFRLIAACAALTLVAAACGDDEDTESTTTSPAAATTTAAADTTALAATTSAPADTASEETTDDTATDDTATDDTATDDTGAGEDVSLDTNGDGEVVFGVAAAGPRDDGGYYQALVDTAVEVSEENGYGEPIVVDNITTEDAATELANLAEQDVDVILVGASEIADPLADLIEQYPDIFWYCNCGAGYPENPGLAQSQDDSSEISYTAGYATGLLMQDAGGESAAFIGCCDLNFEKEAYLAYELGLKAVDESFTMTYIPSGAFPFDFDNTAGATEALNGAVTQGADAVYPFLGGAHEPLVALANENGIITMSAGAADACGRDDLDYQIAVKFDAGEYLDTILEEIVAGEFQEGDTRVFRVGVDPQPGAEICDPTPEQQEAMDAVYEQIAAGDLADEFGAIKGEAYSGG